MNSPSSSSWSRRDLLKAGAGLAASGWITGGSRSNTLRAQEPGERPRRDAGLTVVNPKARVPLSFIIDDSTCLVNLAHFCIPQFAEVFPDQYKQPWRSLPREIPDAFVRRFAAWCRDHGVKGKYSVVPYPACVGWVDRELPGWTRAELEASLEVVRSELMPDWDIHPEMVTHTWVIDTKTGRPYPERSERFMENWGWSVDRSVDELADYMGYALRILKNAGLPCEGVTTPGGFGNRARPQLSQATLEAVRDVFGAEIPHYFRHLYTDDRSVAPRVEYARGLNGPNPECVVSIIGCTGDWFGGWDGLTPGSVDRFITPDLEGGRLPEVIDRGEPAILVCHWPGIYYNGQELGFSIFQEVVRRLEARDDPTRWMTLSAIARYWAARELTAIRKTDDGFELRAPFACEAFTVEIAGPSERPPNLEGRPKLREVRDPRRLDSGTWCRTAEGRLVCFDLPKGRTRIRTEPGAA